jgi:hypothetical protein
MKIIGYINPDTKVGSSSPEYPAKYGGVCLIVGTHPCWEEDVANARLKFGNDVAIIAVNEAVRLIKPDHIATSHDGRIDMFASQFQMKWGYDAHMPALHFRSPQLKTLHPSATAWDVTVGAGSAPFAAAIAVMMGYDLAIFCGCPMDGGGGYALEKTHPSTLDDPRFGLIDKKHQLVHSWKIALRNMPNAIPELASKWRSMSGYTKQIFGGLECPLSV